jgi:hypothetical protein
MTPTKDNLHHIITTSITTHDLAMIVATHRRKIAQTPKRAVRADQVTTTKGITDKEHRSTMKRKDTKNKHRKLWITNTDSLIRDTGSTQKQTTIASNLIFLKRCRRNIQETNKK